MKINIVYDNKDGCIYSKFITMFYKYSKHRILTNSSEVCDITHYLPSYKSPENPALHNTIWVSHQDDNKDTGERFISVAQKASFVFSHSKKYMESLRGQGVNNISQVMPGVDLSKFVMRPPERYSSKNRLIVGYVGRQYNPSERKNPQLLQKISALPFVDFRTTGGMIKEQNLPKFYASSDIIISPATNEGGPMSIIEGLAVGVPIICFDGVGVANEFDSGVLKIKFGDDDAFINRLEKFWAEKEHLIFRETYIMQLLRNQIQGFTWESFVRKHDEAWENLKGDIDG